MSGLGKNQLALISTPIFREAVRRFIQSRNDRCRDLAAKFEVAITTPNRWAIGTATPHPLIQKQITDFIWEQTGWTLPPEGK